jgi:hypothetical protein
MGPVAVATVFHRFSQALENGSASHTKMHPTPWPGNDGCAAVSKHSTTNAFSEASPENERTSMMFF